jgi:hypothetical protein
MALERTVAAGLLAIQLVGEPIAQSCRRADRRICRNLAAQ